MCSQLMITQKRIVIISNDTKYIKIKEFAIKNLIRLINIAICNMSVYMKQIIIHGLLYQKNHITRNVLLTPMTATNENA